MLKVEKVEECIAALKRDFDAANNNLKEAFNAFGELKVASRYLAVRQKGLHLKNTRYSEDDFKPKNSRYVKFDNDENICFTMFNEGDFTIRADGDAWLKMPYNSTLLTGGFQYQLEVGFVKRIVDGEKVNANLLELASYSAEANQLLLIWKKRVDEYANYVTQVVYLLKDIEDYLSFLERQADAIEAKRDANILSAFGIAVETKKPRGNRFTVTITENK